MKEIILQFSNTLIRSEMIKKKKKKKNKKLNFIKKKLKKI